MNATQWMKKVALAAVILFTLSAPVQAATVHETPSATGVTTISYSSSSSNFYFWLDGIQPSGLSTNCLNTTKFGIPVKKSTDELIAQVKMAFLSGKQVKVSWKSTGCAGGAPTPFYIKVYR